MRPLRASLGLGESVDRFQESFVKDVRTFTKLLGTPPHLSLKASFKRGDVDLEALVRRLSSDLPFHPLALKTVAVSTKYEGYIERFERGSRGMERMVSKRISWERLASSPNISHECRQRIRDIRPGDFWPTSKYGGDSPGDARLCGGSVGVKKTLPGVSSS